MTQHWFAVSKGTSTMQSRAITFRPFAGAIIDQALLLGRDGKALFLLFR